MMQLSESGQRRISAAIRAAEAGTGGEIVCVLAKASSNGAAYAVVWSALLALAAPWLLIAFTQLPVREVLLAQLALFIALYFVFSATSLHQFLIPRRARRAEAHRAAMQQFVIRGMGRNPNRAGVLIFVSLAERYARIIADDGIAAKVHESVWRDAIDALLDHIRDGAIADGFVIAVEKCGKVLAQHFPRTEADNSVLPDRIYLI